MSAADHAPQAPTPPEPTPPEPTPPEPTPPDTAGARATTRSAEPLPPLVDWVSRNSGWLILLTVLAVALIEGVGLFYFKRRANAADCAPAQVQASTQAPSDSSAHGSPQPRGTGNASPPCSGPGE